MANVKVAFPLSDGEGGAVENMFAQPLGENRFVLDNTPFYVFDISFCDEFFAEHVDGEIVFSGIASRGGHSTYRIKIPEGKEHEYFLEHWGKLEQLGCTFEGSSVERRRLYAVDIPPNVDVFKAYEVMEEYENLGIWEFEEGHYSAATRTH